MREDALVSIIIPAYNVDKYIFRGIESCMNQTYKNIEIVIVDDGSTDATWDIIEKYKKDDERIVAVHQSNAGVSAARNHALRVASGEYILFLDADDWLEHGTVESLLNIVAKYNNHLICGDCYFVELKTDGTMKVEPQGKNRRECKLSQENALLSIGQPNGLKLGSACYKLYKKDVIDEHQLCFEESVYHGEDGLFVFNYLKYTEGLIYVPIELWNILDRPGSATTSPYNPKWLTAITAIEKMLAFENNSKQVNEYLHYYLAERTLGIAIVCIRSGNMIKSELKLFRKVLKSNLQYVKKQKASMKRLMQYYFIIYAPNKILQRIIMKH